MNPERLSRPNVNHQGPCRPGCGCPIDVVEADSPLINQAASNRGAVKQVPSPTGPTGTLVSVSTRLRVLEFRNTCAIGRAICLTCGMVDFGTLTFVEAPVFVRLRGILTLYGAGNGTAQNVTGNGAAHEVTFDWLNGTSISVTAESVSLDVEYEVLVNPDVPLDDPYVAPAITVAGWAGIGDKAANTPQLTEYIFPRVDIAQTSRHMIPPFAKTVTFLPADDVDMGVQFRGVGVGGPTLTIEGTLTNVGQNNALSQIPIPNGMRAIDVAIPEVATQPSASFVIFGLSL